MAARNYVVDVAGGTATVSIQIQASGTLRQAFLSAVGAAAGSYELSHNPLPQIGTAAPASDVILRMRLLTGPSNHVVVPLNIPVKAFEYIYIHCTGAGNVGEVNLTVS